MAPCHDVGAAVSDVCSECHCSAFLLSLKWISCPLPVHFLQDADGKKAHHRQYWAISMMDSGALYQGGLRLCQTLLQSGGFDHIHSLKGSREAAPWFGKCNINIWNSNRIALPSTYILVLNGSVLNAMRDTSPQSWETSSANQGPRLTVQKMQVSG